MTCGSWPRSGRGITENTSNPRVFLDSSALFAACASRRGASRELLGLAEGLRISIVVSQQVIVETERSLARKRPDGLGSYRQFLDASILEIVADPLPNEVAPYLGLIMHEPDLPILVAAVLARVDYLVTHNHRHFIDDPRVAEQSGLRIGTPGDALAWVRAQLAT